MTTQTQQIRRRTNGTIDIDYYRNHALMERREAVHNIAGGMNILAWPLVAVAALISALVVAGLRVPALKGTASNSAPITVALQAR